MTASLVIVAFSMPQDQKKGGPWEIPAKYEKMENPYKDDASLDTLQPLLKLARGFVDMYDTLWPASKKFRKQADASVLLVMQSVATAFRGMIGCISPIPGDRGVTPEDPPPFISPPLSTRYRNSSS